MFKPDVLDVDEEEAPTQQAGPADIDPSEWLADDPGLVTARHVLPNGRAILIAPLTDAEEQKIQRESRRPDPSDPRRRTREFSLYKRLFIAASLNKAQGRKLGDPGYVLPESLAKKNVGELTGIMQAIMELSGMDIQATGSPTSFFD